MRIRAIGGGSVTFHIPISAGRSQTLNLLDHPLRPTASVARNITGMAAPAGAAPSVRLPQYIVSVGAGTATFKHQDAGSSASNRFLCNTGADIALATDEMAVALYDATTARWRLAKL